MTAATDIYDWSDFAETAYCRLRRHGSHWRVEWGRREPPGSDNLVELGRYETSDGAEATRFALAKIRDLSTEPHEAEQAAEALAAALAECVDG